MRTLESIRSYEQIKTLADARRLEILRLLMASPATITQLAHKLRKSPAWIRHHVVALETVQLVQVDHVQRTGRVREIYYRARADALHFQEVITPRTSRPVLVISGSHDLALEAAAKRLEKAAMLVYMPVGSLDGLVSLRQGISHAAGAHLLDETGEYNTPYVRRLFADRSMDVITLAQRIQGLMLAPGNPLGVKDIGDLRRGRLRFVNRNPGSGTRMWFDKELRRLGIHPADIGGYIVVAKTHTEAAMLIQERKADVAIGLQAAAQQHGLHFIPVFEERFDLVLCREQEVLLAPLLHYLQTAEFRAATAALTGYGTAHSGELNPM